MKISIITFHDALNYGAVLQAYALCQAVKSLGFDSELIDYRTHSYNNVKSTWMRKQLIAFEVFRAKYLPLTPKVYYSVEDLDKIETDALICGSDQIWNLNIAIAKGHMETFFLNFGRGSIKRISYAASTGGVGFPLEYHDRIKRALGKFDFISVREKKSKEDVANCINNDVEVVLDPTFLFDDFPVKDVSGRYALPEKFISIYCVQKNPIFYKAVKEIKKLYGLPVISIGHFDLPIADIRLRDLSPDEWLYMTKNAEFVCTNSFHGTVFAIKFHKQYLSVPLMNNNSRFRCKAEDLIYKCNLNRMFSCLNSERSLRGLKNNYDFRNSRMEELLVLVKLKERFYTERKCLDRLRDPISYSVVDSVLNTHIVQSIGFLRSALEAD